MIFTPNEIAEYIVQTITGRVHKYPKIVHIAKDPKCDLGAYDLTFPIEICHWRGYVELDTPFLQSLTSILEYCMVKLLDMTELDFDHYTYLCELKNYLCNECHKNKSEDMGLFLSSLDFCVHQNLIHIRYIRGVHAVDAIKAVYEQGMSFGKKKDCATKVKLEVEYADNSPVTNLRLDLIKKVSTNLLKTQGYNVQDEVCDHNYIFTIKSEGKTADNHKRYICGAVLNSSKRKETNLTVESYVQNKIDKVKDLCDQRHSDVYIDKNKIDEDVKKIADAAVSHELLSIKHISPVSLHNFDSIDRSVKEGSFMLYNMVRINAILEKHAQLVLEDECPEVPEVEHLYQFSNLDIEEWGLIYNYIYKYPDVLSAAVTIEPKLYVNIQLLWSFVSSLCHEFSRYYRRNRILMKNANYNSVISDIASERLHLLRALRVIIRNALTLLEVKEVKYM